MRLQWRHERPARVDRHRHDRHGDADARRAALPRAVGGSSVVGVLGELLITAGVVVLLFLGWQSGSTTSSSAAQQTAAQAVQEQWRRVRTRARRNDRPTRRPPSPPTRASPLRARARRPDGPGLRDSHRPPLRRRLRAAPIAEGVDLATCSTRSDRASATTRSTQMPGEVGNFALAAHRTTYGAPFADIAELRVGDHIYVETADGWYEYMFRNLEYVLPTGSACSSPVPQRRGRRPGRAHPHPDELQSRCSPPPSASSRYGVMTSWYPRERRPARRDRRRARSAGREATDVRGAVAHPARARVGAGAHPARARGGASCAALVYWVFPWAADTFLPQDVTVERLDRSRSRHRQLRQLRLHPRRLPAAARCRDRGRAQRRVRAGGRPPSSSPTTTPCCSRPAPALPPAGVSIAVVHAALAAGTPLLGVCLGHQAIAEALGATSPTPRSSCTARPR